MGHGRYFWENDPERALNYAKFIKAHPKHGKSAVKKEFVLGAVIDLGNCLNLLEANSLDLLKMTYGQFKSFLADSGEPLPENRALPQGEELIVRNLDCAVIEFPHQTLAAAGKDPYDTTRGVFFEGEPLYPGVGIQDRNHIQICVRNLQAIKGFFRVQM